MIKHFINADKHVGALKSIFESMDCCHCPIFNTCIDKTGKSCIQQLSSYFIEEEGEDSTALKPCPCCGSENIHMFSDFSTEIFCSDCGMRTSEMIHEKDAIEVWNRRNYK